MSTPPAVPGRLDGRTALVTGGARGQGASHAERLAAEGARVVACDVLDEDGEALAARLRESGLDVRYAHLDVTDESAWQDLCAQVGRIDVLVNNAGIIHVTSVEEESRSAWDRLLAVNLTGPMLGIRAAAPRMRPAGGSIINVASIFGVVGAPGYAAYCASKGGLLSLTKVAALELAADRIRVNAIVPGGVSTPMNEHEQEGGVIPDTPMRRRAHVREISGAVAFLASADSTFVTGTEITVDGGFLAR